MRKRNIRIWARVTEAENEIIANRIKKTGLSREAYIRCLLLGTIPKEKPDERFYIVMRELTALCSNLNQIAQKAHALNYIDVPYYKKETEKWRAFRLAVRREFLEPEKLQ
jgi:hypothetical protein